MPRYLLLPFFLLCFRLVLAQDILQTRTGQIRFNAGTALEDIEAVNDEVACILKKSTGELAISLLVRNFHFRRSLMEEHFNENYMESATWPKASFKGRMEDPGKVNWGVEGSYTVRVNGDLTIRKTTKSITVPAKIQVKKRGASAEAAFEIQPSDYEIQIPGVVADKIAKKAAVTMLFQLEPKK